MYRSSPTFGIPLPVPIRETERNKEREGNEDTAVEKEVEERHVDTSSGSFGAA